MHNFDKMQWMETFYATPTELTEQQILKIAAQLDKIFSKHVFSKTKVTRFEKTSFKLTITGIVKIRLQYLKIQIPCKTNFDFFTAFSPAFSPALSSPRQSFRELLQTIAFDGKVEKPKRFWMIECGTRFFGEIGVQEKSRSQAHRAM